MNVAVVLLGESPFPRVLADGTIRDGTVVKQPRLCADCRQRNCRSAHSEVGGLFVLAPGVRASTCSREVDYARIDVVSESVVIVGLRIDGFSGGRSRRAKRDLEGNAVTSEQLIRWQNGMVASVASVERSVEEEIRLSLEMFHDVQTAASSIVRSAEDLQAAQPGRSDDEKFAALPHAAQTLVKASQLLELRLRTMPIVSNPSAASYGNKIRKPVYRLIDMLVRTLQPIAARRNVSIVLKGESRRLVNVYESFDLLPLILLENAVKYSAPAQVVEVDVNDISSGVAVSVSSLSPWIPPEERQKIFGRRYRGASAIQSNKEGSGLGLYIAETVAVAHSTHVLFGSDDADVQFGGLRFSNNRFAFTVR